LSREKCSFLAILLIFFVIKSENMNMEGYTASEMAEILGLNLKTVKLRLFRGGHKPMTHESLYDKSTLEAIKDVQMGRPPKAKQPDDPVQTKPKAKKPQKS
jgi:hypothetical protein